MGFLIGLAFFGLILRNYIINPLLGLSKPSLYNSFKCMFIGVLFLFFVKYFILNYLPFSLIIQKVVGTDNTFIDAFLLSLGILTGDVCISDSYLPMGPDNTSSDYRSDSLVMPMNSSQSNVNSFNDNEDPPYDNDEDPKGFYKWRKEYELLPVNDQLSIREGMVSKYEDELKNLKEKLDKAPNSYEASKIKNNMAVNRFRMKKVQEAMALLRLQSQTTTQSVQGSSQTTTQSTTQSVQSSSQTTTQNTTQSVLGKRKAYYDPIRDK